MHRLAPALFLGLLGACIAPVSAIAGWPNTTSQGSPISTGSGYHAVFLAVPDGAGGAITLLADRRSGNYDVYAQRVDAAGNTLWAAGGVSVQTGAGDQLPVAAVPDGAGGAILVFAQLFGGPVAVLGQRINSSGVRQWTLGGVPITNLANNIEAVGAVSDGAGGIIVDFEYDFSVSDHDIYAQRLSPSGAMLWGASGQAVAASGNMEQGPAMVADGFGGAWVLWNDNRGANFDVYAQRLRPNGIPVFSGLGRDIDITVSGDSQQIRVVSDGAGGAIASWSVLFADLNLYANTIDSTGTTALGGYTLSSTTGDQGNAELATDGGGGFYAFWSDTRAGLGNEDVYGTHVQGNGVRAPGWPDDGAPIATGNARQLFYHVIPDGAGGVLLDWLEGQSTFDIRATRVNANGFALTGWSLSPGTPLTTLPGKEDTAILLPDGSGGAYCYFNSTIGTDVNALGQHIDRFGQVGHPEPAIVSVRDLAHDQGGAVRVAWTPSYLDQAPNTIATVQQYRVWRQAPVAVAQAAMRLGAHLLPAGVSPEGRRERTFRTSGAGVNTFYWEYLGTVPASAQAGYSFSAVTPNDSTASGNPRTSFMVEADGGSPLATMFWDSAPDSGYSVDNLAPAIPAPFTGQYFGSHTDLVWGANSESDLLEYRLYRGTSPGFVPGPGNRVTATPQTNYQDTSGLPFYYKLSAVDIHGNESGFAFLQPTGTTAVREGVLPTRIDLALASPNPARGTTTFSLALPEAAHVRVAVYDAAGRQVHVIEDGERPAGTWTLGWNAQDDGGASVSTGVYFVRLECAERRITRRLLLLR